MRVETVASTFYLCFGNQNAMWWSPTAKYLSRKKVLLSSHMHETFAHSYIFNYRFIFAEGIMNTVFFINKQVGMNPTCLPLCTYDASMSDIRALAFACASEFHNLLRCAAGGRDHSACCTRRGVSESCLDICSARVPDSLLSMAENCLPYIGNIVQCFEEGIN